MDKKPRQVKDENPGGAGGGGRPGLVMKQAVRLITIIPESTEIKIHKTTYP